MGANHASPRERFERHYIPEPNSGCWLWTGSLHPKGYGAFYMPNQNAAKAHVVSFKLFKGDVPTGSVIRHACDNRCCVNPDHLLIGSFKDNTADAVMRGRHPHGERHGAAKLTESEVRAILADPRPFNIIAAEYGVSARTISDIKYGRKWKHITLVQPGTARSAPYKPERLSHR